MITGKIWYSVASNEEAIRTEIYNNGPVEASLSAYEDFYVYKSGNFDSFVSKIQKKVYLISSMLIF